MRRNKKGLSEIVGYVLLIVFAISMSALVYTFLKSSIPKPEVKCPDGVSIEISDYWFDADDYVYLNITNRGLFGINGILITLRNGTRSCPITEMDCEETEKCIESEDKNKIIFNDFLNQSKMQSIYVKYATSTCTLTGVELTPLRYNAEQQTTVLCDTSMLKESISR